MNYLYHRHGRYYYTRKVPTDLKDIDSRDYIRTSLKTDSKREAMQLVVAVNTSVESYWKLLIETNQTHQQSIWKDFLVTARRSRFTLDSVKRPSANGPEIRPEPTKNSLRLSECLEKYWRFEKPKTLNKSVNQIRKWKNPRILAVGNLIDCFGDKAIVDLTREDMLEAREWWMQRILKEEVAAATANKNMVLVKAILESVSDNLKLDLDIKHIFRKILFEDVEQSRRLPFETDYINNTLLKPENLVGLNEQAKWALYAISETGAGFSELVGLQPEDIKLDHEIPHIEIVPRHQKALKTKYRKRSIPLVGYALEAFQACPNGFTSYRDRADALSGTISKFLKENRLLPTRNHTVYSLRHSFQDRLLAANAPDRVQADLMGHKFNRPSYGDGSSLIQKLEWLNNITLRSTVIRTATNSLIEPYNQI